MKNRPYGHFKFPEEIIIEVIELSINEQSWHGAKAESVMLKCSNYGWFPTEILMGVTLGVYDEKHPKSMENGASIGCNLGTAGILVRKDKLDIALNTLRENKYIIESHENNSI